MHEEYSVDSPSDRASSETVTGSAARHDVLEKVSFMTEELENPHPQRFWRRYLLPFCVHMFIFLIYSTLAILALDSQSRPAQQKHNLLYCTCSTESASNLSNTSLTDLIH